MFPGRARRKAPLPADITGMRSIPVMKGDVRKKRARRKVLQLQINQIRRYPVMTAARVKGTPYFMKVPELTS